MPGSSFIPWDESRGYLRIDLGNWYLYPGINPEASKCPSIDPTHVPLFGLCALFAFLFNAFSCASTLGIFVILEFVIWNLIFLSIFLCLRASVVISLTVAGVNADLPDLFPPLFCVFARELFSFILAHRPWHFGIWNLIFDNCPVFIAFFPAHRPRQLLFIPRASHQAPCVCFSHSFVLSCFCGSCCRLA